MSKEAKARIKIIKLLEEAGWRFFDIDEGKANIVLENKAKLTQTELNEFGNKRKMEVPQYTLVGNAVPPLMARAVALEILKNIS